MSQKSCTHFNVCSKVFSCIWIRKSSLGSSKQNLEELKSDSKWRTQEIPGGLKLGKLPVAHMITKIFQVITMRSDRKTSSFARLCEPSLEREDAHQRLGVHVSLTLCSSNERTPSWAHTAPDWPICTPRRAGASGLIFSLYSFQVFPPQWPSLLDKTYWINTSCMFLFID